MNVFRIRPFATTVFLLTCVALVCYAHSLRNEFVWDDHYQIEQNRLLRSWAFVPRLFRSENAESYSVAGEGVRFYRPLCLVAHLVNFQLAGPHPTAFRAVNILLHLLNGCLLVGLLRALGFKYRTSAAVAALFIAHPIHTEAVTFISSRATLLGAMFLFVATISLLFASRASIRRAMFLWGSGSVGAFACGILSKEMAAIFVLQALLIAALQPTSSKRARASIISLTSSAVLTAMFAFRLSILSKPYFTAPVPFAKRALNAFTALAEYARVLIMPMNLHMEHALPISKISTIAGALLFIFLCSVIILQWKREPRLALGCGMFLLGFAAVSGIVPLNATFAEAWMYWPMVGLMICVAVLLDLASESLRWRQATTILAMAAVLVFCALTIRQNRVWKDERTLCETTIARGGDTVRIRSNLARALIDACLYDEARDQLQIALNRDPRHTASIRGMGILTAREGHEAAAKSYFEQALELDPADNVAALWLSALQERLGEISQAEHTLQAAAVHEKTFAARVKLATLYAKSGKLDEGEILLRNVLQSDPLHAAAHNALGTVLVHEGKLDEAEKQFVLALRYDRWMIDPHANLAAIANARGDVAGALRHYNKALGLAPKNADLYYALGTTLQRAGQPLAAEHAFARAVQIDPELTNDASRR